jgi:RNA polymerase sigma-70 factor (ECF subfamily)
MEGETIEAATPRGESAWSWSASDLLTRSELRVIVREEIARLPEPQRVVLLLRDVEGLELREIASLVGAGLTTVKMRLHHGRRVLRAALEPRLASSKAS